MLVATEAYALRKIVKQRSECKMSGNDTIDDTNDSDLSPGELVTIKGLQSKAGKALNGGSAIVLGPPSFTDDGGDNRRCNVMVYALLSKDEPENEEKTERQEESNRAELLSVPLKRSIKEINLERKVDQKCLLFKENAETLIVKHALSARDYNQALFWSAAYYERWPEDYKLGMSYANMLRVYANEPNKALSILLEAVPNLEPNYPMIDSVRYSVCFAYISAKEKPEHALEWALKMDGNTPDDKQMKIEALRAVASYCRDGATGLRFGDIESGDGPVLEVNKSALEALLQIEPDNPEFIRCVGGAYCLLGNNWEGVRYYRRALATGEFQGDDLDDLKSSLALAMMQCPGGRMEHYRVICTKDGHWRCIHKAYTGQYELLALYRDNRSMVGGVRPLTEDGVQMTLIPIPDIDDTEVFEGVDLPPVED